MDAPDLINVGDMAGLEINRGYEGIYAPFAELPKYSSIFFILYIRRG